jgi:iron(III) transport system ATP-binding protein
MRIRIKDLSKVYSPAFGIRNLNLEIEDGSFTTLLGPSGCGKTTLLRMIAGLETPDSGDIYFDDRCVFSGEKGIFVPPEERHLGFVFQDFALWPHMTVYENVAFPLRARKETEGLDAAVKKALAIVHLEGFEKRLPKELSGGQQQRVALARAIIGHPDCVLFDEPLSALDALLRESMRVEMKKITQSLGISSVFVTHDQREAMSMSDKIVVINQGHIEQMGTPEDIYQHPRTAFVARFIGKSNWINDHTMVRPEHIKLIPFEGAEKFATRVVSSQFMGNGYELVVEGAGFQWIVTSPEKYSPDDDVTLFVAPNQIYRFAEGVQ